MWSELSVNIRGRISVMLALKLLPCSIPLALGKVEESLRQPEHSQFRTIPFEVLMFQKYFSHMHEPLRTSRRPEIYREFMCKESKELSWNSLTSSGGLIACEPEPQLLLSRRDLKQQAWGSETLESKNLRSFCVGAPATPQLPVHSLSRKSP